MDPADEVLLQWVIHRKPRRHAHAYAGARTLILGVLFVGVARGLQQNVAVRLEQGVVPGGQPRTRDCDVRIGACALGDDGEVVACRDVGADRGRRVAGGGGLGLAAAVVDAQPQGLLWPGPGAS